MDELYNAQHVPKDRILIGLANDCNHDSSIEFGEKTEEYARELHMSLPSSTRRTLLRQLTFHRTPLQIHCEHKPHSKTTDPLTHRLKREVIVVRRSSNVNKKAFRGRWISGACPMEVHRPISLTCLFVMTRAGDIPIVDRLKREVNVVIRSSNVNKEAFVPINENRPLTSKETESVGSINIKGLNREGLLENTSSCKSMDSTVVHPERYEYTGVVDLHEVAIAMIAICNSLDTGHLSSLKSKRSDFMLFNLLPPFVSVRQLYSSIHLEKEGRMNEGRMHALNQQTGNMSVEGKTDSNCRTIHGELNSQWTMTTVNLQDNITEKEKTMNLSMELEFLQRRKVVLLQLTKQYFCTRTQCGDETDVKTPWWLEYRPVTQQEIAVYMLSSARQADTKEHTGTGPDCFNSNMRKELNRYGSFFTWPVNSAAWPSKLASAGFYYGGSQDEVICFSCGVVRGRWIPGACPMEVHRGISPTCPFVMTRAGDIPIVEDAEAKNYLDRLSQQILTRTLPHSIGVANTQIGSPHTIGQRPSIDPSEVAEHTFNSSGYFSMPQQTAEENEPLSTIHELNSRELQNSSAIGPSSQRLLSCSTARTEHDARTPSLLQQSSNSATPRRTASSVSQAQHTISATASRAAFTSEGPRGLAQGAQSSKHPGNSEFGGTLGICLDRPKYPNYAVAATRVNTFSEKWPHSSFLSPKDLAEAGYLYSGFGDSVKCFFCGIGLKNWDLTDNPWIEHARWSPKCSYLNLSRGMEFVNLVQELSNDGDQTDYNQVMDILKDTQPSAAKAHSPDATEIPIPSVHTKNIAKPTELEDKNSETKDDASLLVENELLRQQTVCKVCMDNEVSIVFLPCGHLSCCAECAPALRECPICRSRVRGTVRAFMS